MDIKDAIEHCQVLVSFHLSAEEHECADEDDGQAISKVLDALAEATTLPEGDLGEAVRGCKEALVQLEKEPSLRFTAMFQSGHVATILRAFAAYKRMSDIADEDRTRLTIVLVEVQDEVVRLQTRDEEAAKYDEEAMKRECEARARAEFKRDEFQAEIVRLMRELAKSTQAEVEATNACRVLEADAMRCSRSAEQAKADVERLKGELAYLSDDCPSSECAVVKKAEAALVEAQKDVAKRLNANRELRAQQKEDYDRAEKAERVAKSLGSKMRAMCHQCRKTYDDEGICVPCDHDISLCPISSHHPVPPCPDCQALRDAIRNAFHDGARDPARRAYPALIELEKAVAKGEIVPVSCSGCNALRKRFARAKEACARCKSLPCPVAEYLDAEDVPPCPDCKAMRERVENAMKVMEYYEEAEDAKSLYLMTKDALAILQGDVKT